LEYSTAIYVLCFLACFCCALLLMLSWRRQRLHLLLWLGIGFSLLCVRNGLLLLNTVLTPESDLAVWRFMLALLAAAAVGYGLVRKTA
jgi:hypothetical protein